MTTFERAEPPARPKQVRIGLWGPPGCGKTTFLAAMYIANLRADLPGGWIMSGADAASAQFLHDSMHQLTKERIFPTSTFDSMGMVFRFVGTQKVFRRNRFGRRVLTPETISFELEVLDVPGTLYANQNITPSREDRGAPANLVLGGAAPAPTPPPPPMAPMAPMAPAAASDTRLLDHLQMCDGIIYLYDPERDAKTGDAFQYFYPVLEQLTGRVHGQRNFTGAKLPQHVAVCVTKFDSPDVFRTAQLRGYTVTDLREPYLPKIENTLAAAFFQELAQNPNSNTDLVANGLMKHFETIEYFITSSIGFYVSGGRFRAHDAMNVARTSAEGDFNIRGKVYPINVLEPLLWLHQSIVSK